MKRLLITFGLCILISSCVINSRIGNRSRFNRDYPNNTDLSNIIYSGGNGSSIEDAIIIKNAKNSESGIASEYDYIEMHYGKRTINWELSKQIFDKKNGKMYDILQIHLLLDDQIKVIHFDITDFYGKY